MSDTQTPKTPEEMAQMRAKLKIYYKEQIEVLKSQKEYELLLSDIEEARLKRLLSIMKMAQLKLQPEEKDSVKENINNLQKPELTK